MKKQYGFVLVGTTDTATPATGSSHFQENGVWTMKSGYGISIRSNLNLMASLSGYTRPSSEAYTLPQYSRALLPEYRYSTASGCYVTLENMDSYAAFPNFEDYGQVHFTPLWFPDGDYTIRITHSDCWTPAGMLIVSSVTKPIVISGSAYDDYYVGH